jgi:DNA-directed RNA polymerase subunit RPC12/RpoP
MPANHGFSKIEPPFELDVEVGSCSDKRQHVDSHFTANSNFCFTDVKLPQRRPYLVSNCQLEVPFTSSDPIIYMTSVRRSTTKRSVKVPEYNEAVYSTNSQPQSDPDNEAASSSTLSASGDNHSHFHASSSSTTRRDRKMSFTDNRSKTFVCTLCSRRFRRQEHLKRHHHSLHTHDKPFECTDCGKKFSRSDNLGQHQRTHGAGIVVKGVMSTDMTSQMAVNVADVGSGVLRPGSQSPDASEFGSMLFDHAAALASSSSSSGYGDDSAEDASFEQKKRELDDWMMSL